MKKQSDQKRVKEIIKILSEEIPNSRIALRFSDPLELLIATISLPSV
jgi:endonuclease III